MTNNEQRPCRSLVCNSAETVCASRLPRYRFGGFGAIVSAEHVPPEALQVVRVCFFGLEEIVL